MAFHHKHHYIRQTLLRPNTDCTPCPRLHCIKLGAISTSSISLDTLIAFKPATNKRQTSAHTQDRKRKQGVYVGYAGRCEHHGCSCVPSASVNAIERSPASCQRQEAWPAAAPQIASYSTNRVGDESMLFASEAEPSVCAGSCVCPRGQKIEWKVANQCLIQHSCVHSSMK